MRYTTLALLFCLPAAAQRLTLEEAAAIAIKNNPRIALDDLLPQVGDEVATGVRSALFPTIVANTTAAGAAKDSRLAAGALNNPIIFSRFALGASVSQLVTDFGRTSTLVDSARLRAQSQRQLVQATRSQILLAVHRAFLSALRARTVLQVSERTLAARQLLLEQVSALAKSNLKSTLDVSFAEVNVSEARLAVVTARNDADAAVADLSAVMGYQRPQSLEVVESPFDPSAPPPADGLIDEAIRSRPEIHALRLERQAAEKFARAESKLTLPTVSALANVGVAPARDERLRGRFAAAGVNLSVPVFNGHLFEARKREAELRLQAVDQRLKELENGVAREVSLAVLHANTGFQRIELTAQLVRQAGMSLDLAQERYNLGLSSFIELSQAELNKTAAEIRNAAARYDYQLLRAIIDYQTGRLR